MVYDIVVRDMNDPRGRWKNGRHHRNWSEADLFLRRTFDDMRDGDSRKIAVRVESLGARSFDQYLGSSFTLERGDDENGSRRYIDGSLMRWFIETQYPEYADELAVCMTHQ